MKKILLSLVCLSLFGCSDNKVTKEYLVGKWNCIHKEYGSEYDSKLKRYSDYFETDSEQVIQSYEIVNGILLSKTENHKAIEFDLDIFYNNLNMEALTNLCGKWSYNKKLSKNTSNEFTYEREEFCEAYIERGYFPLYPKTKILKVCTRIK
ncbi:hypothetical protein A9G15_04440 [Gilliamella apis]|uniref:hypothetical protein n=1 Tax=Gilliamella apis TaxID=1970738 RepID=UPI0004D5EDF7|nr:hypothetical protein [Gilliamella apis]KES14717.1 Glycosyltransferase family 6 [Gilliamella apis SCGC AB-598-P17]OCG04349.1 hypothetical protein A9G15_04440 [Gilliamella apis]